MPEIHFPLVSQCVQAYHCDCVAQLGKAMDALAPGSSTLLARYLYLRSLVLLRQGRLLDALLDFQCLYKTDLGIFPAKLVRQAVQSMSGPERTQAERMPELRRFISEVLVLPGETPRADDGVKHFELPRTHLQLGEFVQRVQESGIVKDAGIISLLFEALTPGKGTGGPAPRWLPAAGGLCHRPARLLGGAGPGPAVHSGLTCALSSSAAWGSSVHTPAGHGVTVAAHCPGTVFSLPSPGEGGFPRPGAMSVPEASCLGSGDSGLARPADSGSTVQGRGGGASAPGSVFAPSAPSGGFASPRHFLPRFPVARTFLAGLD